MIEVERVPVMKHHITVVARRQLVNMRRKRRRSVDSPGGRADREQQYQGQDEQDEAMHLRPACRAVFRTESR